MRLKQGRGKKGSVAPMSDGEDSNGAGDLHQSGAYQSRLESRGVSFTTSRGRIWLILVINLFIVTTFIFMSSSRFPSQFGEGVVNDALEQGLQHPGPVNKNADQALSLAAAHSAVTEEPQVQETYRPGGYTKLTGTDQPKAPGEELDLTESETEAPASGLPSNYIGDPSDIPAALTGDQDEESEPPLVTQKAYAPTSDVDPDTIPPATIGDTSLEPASNGPYSGQRPPTEIADLISRMKESQPHSSETLPSSPEQPAEAEYSLTTSTTAPQPVEIEPSAVESKDFLDNLSVWLTSDSAVEVENLAACLVSSGADLTACGVNSWANQVASSDPKAADSTAFRAASPEQKPVWIPIVPDTHNQLPAVYFSCPMVTDALRVHESMTFFFVLSPAQIETGDSFTGQKFFGNSPYGQFALHGGKPSFFANNGLVESVQGLATGQFSLVTYRLNQGYVEIKVNSRPWGGESPREGDPDERQTRITVNEVVSLGNSKGACDTNAFQGRIAEVLVYDTVLDDSKVGAVEKYLHDKWWGHKPFPETTASSDSKTASEFPREGGAAALLTVAPVDPATEAVPVAPGSDPQTVEETQRTISTGTPLAGYNSDVTQESTTAELDATPAPKFDPRVNIFEWTPPSNSELAAAEQWTSTVKEKVDYIRNFQLGGDVLRVLIRQHKDELVVLREELFG